MRTERNQKRWSKERMGVVAMCKYSREEIRTK